MRRPNQLSPETRRVVKFTLVGVANTGVALVSYAVLVAVGVSYLAAGPIGWTLGVIHGYTWNRIWTFDYAAHYTTLMTKYAAVAAVGLLLNTGLLGLLVEVMGAGKLVAEAITLPIVVLTTFALNRYWVFAEHLRTTSASRI
jgi:putative flippase GtrA